MRPWQARLVEFTAALVLTALYVGAAYITGLLIDGEPHFGIFALAAVAVDQTHGKLRRRP